MNRTLDVASSFFATLARLPAGMTVGELGPRPKQPLELYEFEACPFCRQDKARSGWSPTPGKHNHASNASQSPMCHKSGVFDLAAVRHAHVKEETLEDRWFDPRLHSDLA